MYSAERPVTCHIHPMKSEAFSKYAHHTTGHHALQDKVIMHGVQQMAMLT